MNTKFPNIPTLRVCGTNLHAMEVDDDIHIDHYGNDSTLETLHNFTLLDSVHCYGMYVKVVW